MSSVVGAMRAKWGSEMSAQRAALLAIVALAIVLRLLSLDRPMHVDEKLTVTYFIDRSWWAAVSDYTLPNNHILHTVLAKASTAVFGHTLWALRLPALVAGIAVVPATYAAVDELYGARAALIAAALVAPSDQMIAYSTSARGYSLVTLAFLTLVVLGARLQKQHSRGGWIAFAVVAALGLWTIPVMLLPLGAATGWMAISFARRRAFVDLRRLSAALALAGAMTALLYAPVVARSGLSLLARNEYVVPSTWPEFLAELPRSLADTAWSWTVGMPTVLVAVLTIGILVAVVRHAKVSRCAVGLPQVAVGWCALFLAINHRAPPVRVWQWLLPMAAGLAGAGLLDALERAPRRVAPPRFAALVVALGVVEAVALLTTTS